RNRSHWSTSKTPSYTKSVSWQHHLKPTPVYANYFDNTTDFRPARERIFICGETLKGEDPSKYIRQKYGHHGPGVDHNQQFDNGIMGLNSLKEARDKNNKIIYSSGLSCFQPH
ncbi:DUF4049 domain-containing protein, partial [Escherichia coli]|uniref:DUF4049 domain-containing protein n=1 Tax=Escherichia coli TaxID=562 RepID=UPI003FD49BE5